MATAPYCFPHPSAATYPPNFSAGYYPPLSSSDPAPASGFFPCAATECTVHAGTAATGLSYAELWSTPSTFVHPPIFSPPPLPQNPSILNPSTQSMATSPIYTSACAPVTSAEGSSANLVDTKPQQPVCYPTAPAAFTATFSPVQAPLLESSEPPTPSLTATGVPSSTLDLEKSKPSAEAQVRAEANISKDMPRAVLDLKRRLDELQARDRTSFDKLRGELAKLTSMATQLAISLSKHSTSPHTSTPAASAAVPASAVSQVFVEMPTPTSWQGTDGTAPNDCSGHHDPIQSTCVSNRSEQNLDYFLEQAAPETIFDVDDDKLDGRSNEFVPMFTATPEQQINGVEQQEDDQPLKCFCKPPETEHNSACLYNLSDVQDFTFEVQPQDDKRACSDPIRKPSDSLAPRCSQLSIDQSMRDLKLQWDPGASASLYSSNAKPPEGLSSVAIGFPEVLNLCNRVGPHVQQLRDPYWNVLVARERREEWDPGGHTILSSTLNRDILGVPSCVSPQNFCNVPLRQESRGIQFEWDPGTLSLIDMLLAKTAVADRVHSSQTPFNLFTFIEQPVDLKQLLSQLLPQSHSWYNTPNVCLQVQYLCLQMVLAYPCSVPVCYTSKFSSAAAILSAMCMSIASTMRMILVLDSRKTIQEENGVVAVYQVSKIQLSKSKTSNVWDPGTIVRYTFIWLVLDTVRETLYAYYLAGRHSNRKFIYYPEIIMCYLTVSTVLEEKEMPSGPSIGFWSSKLEPMRCSDHQTCNSLSFQQYSHQDITFREITLWLIHFQPP